MISIIIPKVRGRNAFWGLSKCAIFMLVFSLMFSKISEVLSDKTAKDAFAPFWETDEDIDLLLIGNSTIHSGISPLDLYHEYGIASYNLAIGGQTIPNNYWALRSAFSHHVPKVVVMDISYLFNEDKFVGQAEARLHQCLDNIPHNYIWLMAIYDLFHNEIIPSDQVVNYLFPVAAFHSRWDSLTNSDFKDKHDQNYGGGIENVSRDSKGNVFDATSLYDKPSPLPVIETEEYPELNDLYIHRIARLCEDYDVDIVFIKIPTYSFGETDYGDEERIQRMYNRFYDTAKELGVHYINGVADYQKVGFVFSRDLRDYHHLNISGNKKMTEYVGKWLSDNYDLPDRRGDSAYDHWETEYGELEKYRQNLVEMDNDNREHDNR